MLFAHDPQLMSTRHITVFPKDISISKTTNFYNIFLLYIYTIHD